MKESKYFCYEIYKNISVWSNNGKISYNPCSFFNGHIKQTNKIELEDVWHQKEHRAIMLQVENNMPVAGCQGCYSAEKSGLDSRRMGAKQQYEEFHQDTNINLESPQGLDYSVGNLCNLKCMICGPKNSTAWIPDYQKLNPTVSIEKYKKNFQSRITDSKFLKNLKNIHFHGGGEPLLSTDHIDLLNKVKEVKGLGDVRVFYNTNGTVKASDQLLSLWEECKLIEIYFSIDDVGKRFDYQRTGAKWSDVQANIVWYKREMPHNHMFNINCTWSYLNLYYLDELVDWYQNNFKTNRYGDPTNLLFQKAIGSFSIDHISVAGYNKLINKFQDYPQLLALIRSLDIKDSVDHNNFWEYVNQLDSLRNTSFRNMCPEWSELL